MKRLLWIALIFAPVALLWRVVFAGRVLFWGVPLLQFYPWQQWAVEMWRSGQVPLWNPYVGNGAPLAANLQSAVFYPLNFLYLILPVEHAMSYTAVLHIILAGLGLYAWGRTFGLRPVAALVGALAFQLSQFVIARLAFLSITATFPWLSIWLWRTEVLIRKPRLSNALWLALAVGMGLLAGHAQTAGIGLVVVVCYASARWRAARGKTQEAGNQQTDPLRHLLSPIGYMVLALTLGIALAMVQLLPAAELASQSQRAGGLDYEFASTHSLHPLRLLTFLAPDLQGHPADGNFWGYDNYWENAGYVGVWALLMALFALTNLRTRSSSSRSAVCFLGLAALLSLLIALGRFAPFYALLFRLPGASLFQGPARLLCVYTLAVSALAGIGTEQLIVDNRLRWSGRLMLAAAVSVAAAAVAAALAFGVSSVLIRPVIQFGLTLGACAACLAFRPAYTSRRFGAWAVLLMGVVALDLLVADARLNPTTDASLYHAPTASAQIIRSTGSGRVLWLSADEHAIKFERYLTFSQFGPEDATYWHGLRETLLPNAAMIERVPSTNNFDSLLPGHYNQLIRLVNQLPEREALRVASVMDAHTIASPRDLPLPVVQRGAQVTFYRNDAAPGRAWIVPQARAVDDALAALTDPTFDPRQTVLLEQGKPNRISPSRNLNGQVQFLQDSPNAVTIRATSETGGWLVLADTHYPGWQATLDDQPIPIMRANVAFRAVELPPGEHIVKFRYAPLSFTTGAAISLLTCAGWLAALLWLRRRAPHRRGELPV